MGSLILTENYEIHWQGVNFQGKRILDVGADTGSTSRYFLSKGASQIIAVEGNHDYYRQLESYASQEVRVVPVELYIHAFEDFAGLILHFKPDLVKVDVEGSERHLLDVSNSILEIVPEYIIEAHSQDLELKLLEKLSQSNYQIGTYVYVDKAIIIGKQLSKYRLTYDNI